VIEVQYSAKAVAESAGLKVEPIDPKEQTLAQAAQAYIRDAKGRQANEAAFQAEIVTAEFLRVVKKSHIDQVKREDILRFHDSLRNRGVSDRTISNKHARLKSWLRFSGADDEIFPPAPTYEKKLPMGHEDLDSTLRYLRPATGTQLRTRINSVQWGG